MLNKERIENNPYRILGVYVGNPLSLEVSHLSRICAFSKVGQIASFRLRGDDILRPIVRTEDSANAAYQTISISKDRIENALLWFGEEDKEWGTVLNEAVQAIIQGDYAKAINYYEKLISDDSLRESFLESTTHGLMTFSREQLAVMISELIISCEDDLESFWMSDCGKPSGLIALILFEKCIPVKLESLIQSIEFYNILGTLSTGKELHGIDFYEYIDRFEKTLNEIQPLLEKVGEMYGIDSIQYKEIAEDICRKTYSRGVYLIKEIGEFVWLHDSKNRLNDNSYKKYRSNMPIGTIKACMDLISRIDTIVNETVNAILIDDLSKIVLYSDIDSYQSIKDIEFVDRDDIIRRSVRSFQIKRGVTIAAWLAFLYLIFG